MLIYDDQPPLSVDLPVTWGGGGGGEVLNGGSVNKTVHVLADMHTV